MSHSLSTWFSLNVFIDISSADRLPSPQFSEDLEKSHILCTLLTYTERAKFHFHLLSTLTPPPWKWLNQVIGLKLNLFKRDIAFGIMREKVQVLASEGCGLFGVCLLEFSFWTASMYFYVSNEAIRSGAAFHLGFPNTSPHPDKA